MAADEHAPFRRLVRVPSAHHVDPHRRLAVDTVVDALEPPIEPAQLEGVEIDGGIGRELRVPRVAETRAAVGPGAYDESLQALLVRAEPGEVQVRDLQRPGVVPAGHVIDGDVLVVIEMIDDFHAHVAVEGIAAAVAHGTD